MVSIERERSTRERENRKMNDVAERGIITLLPLIFCKFHILFAKFLYVLN
jgi:hypothetical protein